MYKSNIDVNDIAKIVELSKEEVEKNNKRSIL